MPSNLAPRRLCPNRESPVSIDSRLALSATVSGDGNRFLLVTNSFTFAAPIFSTRARFSSKLQYRVQFYYLHLWAGPISEWQFGSHPERRFAE